MKPAKILVVDDEVEMEQLIKQRFRHQINAQEYEFLFATNGNTALQQFQANPEVDMVLTDINMPEMDGLALLESLSVIDQTVKTVVVSAYSDLPNLRKAMNQGAFDFLVKPLDFQDLKATIAKTLKCVEQVREHQRQSQQTHAALLHKAFYDSLTEIPNRAYFMKCLSQVIERQNQGDDHGYAVLFIDLDHFKMINDRKGHLFGDELLKCVALRLKTCLRQTDMVARLGGDEFVVLLDDTEDQDFAVHVAQRIEENLKQPFLLKGCTVLAGASIGVVIGSKAYQQPEDLLRHADAAMYDAKALRTGSYTVFSSGLKASL